MINFINDIETYFQIHVVLLIFLDDNFAPQFALRPIVGIHGLQPVVESNHGFQMLSKLTSRGYGHQDLIFTAI